MFWFYPCKQNPSACQSPAGFVDLSLAFALGSGGLDEERDLLEEREREREGEGAREEGERKSQGWEWERERGRGEGSQSQRGMGGGAIALIVNLQELPYHSKSAKAVSGYKCHSEVNCSLDVVT